MQRGLLALQLCLVRFYTIEAEVLNLESDSSGFWHAASAGLTNSPPQELVRRQIHAVSHASEETSSLADSTGLSKDELSQAGQLLSTADEVGLAKQASSVSLSGPASWGEHPAADGSHLRFYGTVVSDGVSDLEVHERDDNTTISEVRARVDSMLKKSGLLSHENAPGKGFVDASVFLVGFAFFSIGACISIYYESIRLNAQPDNARRDNLLDIAKFILITLVLACHLCLGYPASTRYSVTWDNCDMPAFFIICGIVSKWGESLPPRKELLRNTFRDCVLSNLLFMLVTSTPPFPATTPFGLWFLCALALYRVGLGFVFQLNVRTFGTVLGGIFALVKSMAFTWIWMRSGRDALFPTYPFHYEMNCIAIHAPFFILGLIFQSWDLHRFLRTPVASCLAGTVLVGWWYVVVVVLKRDEFSLYGGWISCKNLGNVQTGDDVLSSMPMWLWTLAMKACLALALIVAAAPLSQAPLVSDFFARLGRRSLYGYVLQMIILHGIIGWGTGIDALSKLYVIHPSVAIAGVIFSMMVLCSPLAEALFKWLVCPQWALTLADGLVQRLVAPSPVTSKEAVTVPVTGKPPSC